MPLANVGSKWVSGDLVFFDKGAGTTIATFKAATAELVIAENDNKLGQLIRSNDATVYSDGGAIDTSGIALITGGTGIADLTLAAPSPGVRCEIRIDSLSSGDVVVTTAAGVTFDGTNNTATLDAAAEALILVYKSATEWEVVENVGSVALSSV